MRFKHTKPLNPGDRVTVHLSDGFVGRATVIKHILQDWGGHMKVRYDDKERRLRTVDDWLCVPLETLDLLAEIADE